MFIDFIKNLLFTTLLPYWLIPFLCPAYIRIKRVYCIISYVIPKKIHKISIAKTTNKWLEIPIKVSTNSLIDLSYGEKCKKFCDTDKL